MDEEREHRHDERSEPQRPEEAAAKGGTHGQQPEQDETEDAAVDSEAHSDAPGPFGTG